MAQAQTTRPFPRPALIGAAAMIGFTMVAATVSRLTGGAHNPPTAAALMARDLAFDDQSDGSILVRDVSDGRTVDVLAPGSNGFIRASLRSLAHRREFDGNESRVFHLTAWADGRLTLGEPGTDLIDLEAFGQTNEAAFARLLTDRETAP